MTVSPRIALLLALPLTWAVSLHAQAASTSSAPAADSGGPVVKLSPFEVTSQTTGYSASETMTGSRVNTKIEDLPYSVVNLTNDFFKDYGV